MIGYRLHGMDSIPDMVRFFSSPKRPDRFFRLRSLLFTEYRGRGMWTTTHLLLVARSRMVELYLHTPIRIYGMCIIHQEQEQLIYYSVKLI
jgi:hypothetical protein